MYFRADFHSSVSDCDCANPRFKPCVFVLPRPSRCNIPKSSDMSADQVGKQQAKAADTVFTGVRRAARVDDMETVQR